jgi:hypothetical protein
MRSTGLRPVRYRPYVDTEEKLRVAVVWARDGRDWRLVTAEAADQVASKDTELRDEGFRPVDVVALRDQASGHAVFAALWEAAREPNLDPAVLYCDVAQQNHETEFAPLEKAGLYPRTRHTYFDDAGEPHHSMTWSSRRNDEEGYAFWFGSRDFYESKLSSLSCQLDIVTTSFEKDGSRSRIYAGCWTKSTSLQSSELHDLPLADHLARCRELARDGWRPAAISVDAAAQDQLQAASVWLRPRWWQPATSSSADELTSASKNESD